MMGSLLKLIPNILGFKLSRSFGLKPPLPINITVSVTNLCNSHCKTCFIWKSYQDHPELREKEFDTWEFKKTFESLGNNPEWFVISGGEPFLRTDLVEICAAVYDNCSPQGITIPTNALLPTTIEKNTARILEQCPDAKLIVNVSLDGIGDKHDEIRGVEGNFTKFIESYDRLMELKKDYQNLSVGIHSVISRYNVDHIFNLYEFIKTLNPDSYISEVAENRSELFNLDSNITPEIDLYTKLIKIISKKVKEDYIKSKDLIQKVTQAFRITYYQLLSEKPWIYGQVIPCYAGYASCQITPYGDVWPCCILGYDKPMGNLREVDYDFKQIWFSDRAIEIRKYIKDGSCACPLANASYTNILCNSRECIKALWFLISH